MNIAVCVGKKKEEESKSKIVEIQGMKDRLKHENDNLKKIKNELKENQEKQRIEKDVSTLKLVALEVTFMHGFESFSKFECFSKRRQFSILTACSYISNKFYVKTRSVGRNVLSRRQTSDVTWLFEFVISNIQVILPTQS